jgi:tripartite-type tricarboxylate transporter receptor subunit TctC
LPCSCIPASPRPWPNSPTRRGANRVYNFGSPGSGSLGHLAGVWFNALTGADLVHVPYRGSGPALQDLLAGRVHVLFDNIPTALSQVQSGSVRALAVTASMRAAVLPDVPTIREAGLPEFEILSWTILLAPATTATATIDTTNAALNAALRDPAVRWRLAEAGVDGRGGRQPTPRPSCVPRPASGSRSPSDRASCWTERSDLDVGLLDDLAE